MIKILSISLIYILCQPAFAQFTPGDAKAILAHQNNDNYYNKRNPKFLLPQRKGIERISPFRFIFGSLMFGYQKIVSPLTMANCLYSPSCSNFSKQCIERFGLIKGIALSADRLTRCNTLSIREHDGTAHDDSLSDDDPSDYMLK